MYGGSALRICYNLNRMSVDLDFEIKNPITEKFLKKLKKEIELYFKKNYEVKPDFLVIKINNRRGLNLKFIIEDNKLNTGYSSNQIHVKIDLNFFTAPETVIERIPINKDQFSFVIKKL